MLDVQHELETVGTMQCLLQVDGKPITESWHYAFRIYHL